MVANTVGTLVHMVATSHGEEAQHLLLAKHYGGFVASVVILST
jgi:hypothetical protein